MFRSFLLTVVLLGCVSVSNAETLATTKTLMRKFTLDAIGDPWSKDCDLILSSEEHKGKAKVSLKQASGLCALFGPVKLYATDSADRKSSIVIVEAAIGGDGDHSGPILQIFSLGKNVFRKLGEQELFDAEYKQTDGSFTSSEGKVLFSFCDVCDGPDAAAPKDNIYVPAKLTLGCGGICVKPHIKSAERNKLIQSFNAAKDRTLKEQGDADYLEFVKKLEKDFNAFLRRK